MQKLPHDNPLTKGIGSEFSQLNSIRSALDSIKKAGLSPGELREIIKQISIQLDEIEPAVCAKLNTKLSVSYIEELQDKIAELLGHAEDDGQHDDEAGIEEDREAEQQGGDPQREGSAVGAEAVDQGVGKHLGAQPVRDCIRGYGKGGAPD